MKRLAMILSCSVILMGCVSTSTVTTPMASNDADAYIRTAGPRFTSAFNAGNWDTVGSFYADDAVVLAPNAEIAMGPAGARQVFGSIAPMRPRLSISPDRIVQSCDLAFEYGRYEMDLTPPGASMIHDRGKYVTVWRRMPGGDWKILGDMFNTSIPAPGM